MRRRSQTTPLLEEQRPLPDSTNSKCLRLGWPLLIVIVISFLGILSFLLDDGFYHRFYWIPRAAGNYTLLGDHQAFTCFPALNREEDNVVDKWVVLNGGQASSPLAIYTTIELGLAQEKKLRAMNGSIIDFSNFSYTQALRDCANLGAAGRSGIMVIGQDDAVFSQGRIMRVRNRDDIKVNPSNVEMCFHSLFGSLSQPRHTMYLTAQYWNSTELESVAQYIESRVGFATHNSSSAELAETWCMRKRAGRKKRTSLYYIDLESKPRK